MTDKLRAAFDALMDAAATAETLLAHALADGMIAEEVEDRFEAWRKELLAAHGMARDALSAAPRPAPGRETLVEVIDDAIEAWMASASGSEPEHIADALLARGLRLPAPETMAWAVVSIDGQIMRVSRDGRELAEKWAGPGDSIARVAIRVVGGGDDAA